MTDEILKVLNAMGATVDDVAAALSADGVTARRGATSFRNPITRYINRHLDVDGGRVAVPFPGGLLTVVRDGSCYTVALPKPVAKFLDRFHAGEFPLLEEP